jgi:hypothetical protein
MPRTWILIGFVIAEGICLHTPIGQVRAQTWYYCDTTHAYYPYVSTCPVPWRVVIPNQDAYGGLGQQQSETNAATVAPAHQEQVGQQSWSALLTAYWEATGTGGVFMALGVLLLVLGMGHVATTPTRIETQSGGPGVILRTKYPGHTPTKSDIKRAWKLFLWGAIMVLSGVCITYGPMAVYSTLHALLVKTYG